MPPTALRSRHAWAPRQVAGAEKKGVSTAGRGWVRGGSAGRGVVGVPGVGAGPLAASAVSGGGAPLCAPHVMAGSCLQA